MKGDERAGYQPMPEVVSPMLVRSGRLPANQAAYGFEIKWDGIRAIGYLEEGRLRLTSRNLKELTPQFPELQRLARAAGGRELVLDGEIVALGDGGKPSFALLQQRLNLTGGRVARAAAQIPVAYLIFDLIYLDGCLLQDLPYLERRRRLEALDLTGFNWQTPGFSKGKGKELLAASRRLGLEGVVAKRLDSPYQPGRRTGAWLKIKNLHRQELVIGGWMAGRGGGPAALLLGYYDLTPEAAERQGVPQRLLYAGKVGTGFTADRWDRLAELLSPLQRERCPFACRPPVQGGNFVEPVLVCEVEFTEWTPHGTLRHPSFKGLRGDKDPRWVIREEGEPVKEGADG